ncbi:fimbrial protein [Rahnella laticis]|uniref:fimbrial protein n=1 Tax=Rahnella laticis TaxID=2787622 RepID=UPI0018A2B607|nr:fimbrial protein [Rahnella laticis]MBF7997764.1 type 1 fimbrial protein [Rahnella laticis]
MKRKYPSATVFKALLPALIGKWSGCALISMVFSLTSFEANAQNTLASVDGEHGLLHIYGQLVDSPCRLSMDSRDQSVDLGTLASGDLSYPGARSWPVYFTVHLQGCLVASGHLDDERTDGTVWGADQPVVSVNFTAPADFNDPSLIRLNGVQGIALRVTDSRNRDMRLGSRGVPQLLTPGDNTLSWKVQAERVPGQLVPGRFQAVADFRMSYD